MTNHKTVVFLLFIMVIIAGCCKLCTCIDEQQYEDSLYFRFELDSLNGGYTRQDIDTSYIVRYKKDSLNRPIDTTQIELIGTNFRFGESFTAFGNYDYSIEVPKLNKKYYVTNILVNGQVVEDKCCQCYQNNLKTFRLDSVEKDQSGSRSPIYLKK
ncbi:MAG: hypothetical protein ACKVTZ_17015 [Bacteroidia bacterium]